MEYLTLRFALIDKCLKSKNQPICQEKIFITNNSKKIKRFNPNKDPRLL